MFLIRTGFILSTKSVALLLELICNENFLKVTCKKTLFLWFKAPSKGI